MMETQWWCCSYFEVPYHGVSSENVAGHLSLALRNKSEKRVQRPHVLKFQEKGGFLTDAHQLLLRGVVGIANWQMTFIPCVNATGSMDPDFARQTLMEALHRTEPGFQRQWVSGYPGSIPFASVEYLLTVDRHERVYKFDPISNLWSSSLDGARSTPSARIFHDSTNIPHTPVRLLVCTTNLEVYAFRLCSVGFSLNKDELCSKDEAKRILHQFLTLLTSRLHNVRTDSGINLTEKYLAQLCLKYSATNQTSSPQQRPSYAPSLDLFQLSKIEDTEDDVDQTGYINHYPVHPIERARRHWSQLPGEHDWIENSEFSYCRTYPLVVPSIRFQHPLTEMRRCFEGYRFPVLSYYHINNPVICQNDNGSARDIDARRVQNYESSMQCFPVRLLRSGQFTSSVPLDSFLNSYVTKPIFASVRSRRFRSTRIVQIRLHETSMEAICTISDSFLPINATGQVSRPKPSASKTPSQSTWYIPLITVSPDTRRSNVFMSNRSRHSHYESSSQPTATSFGYEFSWCAPKSQAIRKAWLRLGSLVRLSQLHLPTSETTPAENPDDETIWPNRRSVSAMSMLDVHSTDSESPSSTQYPLWLDENYETAALSVSPHLLHCFRGGERPKSQTESSPLRTWRLSIGNLSRSTKSTGADAGWDTASLLGEAKPRLPLRTSLNSLAMQRAVHRSDWYTHLYDTKWFDLIRFGLNQASELAKLLMQLSSSPNQCGSPAQTNTDASCNETAVILTGPGSGRTWQPLLTSLTQLILWPVTRTLSGFEDLIEREWVRYGYPFAPDPPDWHDNAVADDYDTGATFALFLDCVHQMLYQFPTEFAFTEDYLVALLDCALSRGGGLPPFAIEFACSCDAARCVSSKGVPKSSVQLRSDRLFEQKVLRSFRDWTGIYTVNGCRLFANWWYWWRTQPDPPLQTESKVIPEHVTSSASGNSVGPLFPLTSPASFVRLWIHAWLRWNRSLRLCRGGGYAFDAAFYRGLLSRDPIFEDITETAPFLYPATSASPYSGWLSDEAILRADSQATGDTRGCHTLRSRNAFVSELIRMASAWETSPDSSGSCRDRTEDESQLRT